MNLTGKTIVLGVTGGIAAYKSAQLASDLVKTGAQVRVVMTENATEFIAPMVFETLTNHPVAYKTFDRSFEWNVQHVSLAQSADLFVIAPATANVIAKMAAGIADDMLTTTVLAASGPKLIAPAMNTGMWENPVTQRNISTLKELGCLFVEPATGLLACGDVGKGRLAPLDEIMDAIESVFTQPKDLSGLKVLVTAGATRESIDPVRFITNHSTGKMGYAVAKAARLRGAEVTLVSGVSMLSAPNGVNVVSVQSAAEMAGAVLSCAREMDVIVKAAAVADYTPVSTAQEKIKKAGNAGDELTLHLTRTQDILYTLGQNKKSGQVLCGFSMETENLVENSRAKLEKKNADLIVANSLRTEGAGFGVDTNIVTMITREEICELPLMSKAEAADHILSKALLLYQEKQK